MRVLRKQIEKDGEGSVSLIADEDEVAQLRDHHLGELARQAERADPDELQSPARQQDPSRIRMGSEEDPNGIRRGRG